MNMASSPESIPPLSQEIVSNFLSCEEKFKGYTAQPTSQLSQKCETKHQQQTMKKTTNSICKSDASAVSIKRKESVITKYLRSFSAPKESSATSIDMKRKALELPLGNTKWYSDADASEGEKSTLSTSNTSDDNGHSYKRKNSYLLATRNDFFIDVENNVVKQPRDSSNSYVTQTIKKFERKISIDNDCLAKSELETGVQSNIDNLFKTYHRMSKTDKNRKEHREKLSLEINDTLLNRYREIKNEVSTSTDINRKPHSEPETKPDEEETECITFIYDDTKGTLTKYEEDNAASVEPDYVIVFKDDEPAAVSTQPTLSSSEVPLQLVDDKCRKSVREICDKIQEQFNDIIKNFNENDTNLDENNSEDGGNKTKRVFEFWKKRDSFRREENNYHQSVTKAPDIVAPENDISPHMKNIDMGYSTEDDDGIKEAKSITTSIEYVPEPEAEPVPVPVAVPVSSDEIKPNITDQRRSSYLYSSISTNSDVSEHSSRVNRYFNNFLRRKSTSSSRKCESDKVKSLQLSFSSHNSEPNTDTNSSKKQLRHTVSFNLSKDDISERKKVKRNSTFNFPKSCSSDAENKANSLSTDAISRPRTSRLYSDSFRRSLSLKFEKELEKKSSGSEFENCRKSLISNNNSEIEDSIEQTSSSRLYSDSFQRSTPIEKKINDTNNNTCDRSENKSDIIDDINVEEALTPEKNHENSKEFLNIVEAFNLKFNELCKNTYTLEWVESVNENLSNHMLVEKTTDDDHFNMEEIPEQQMIDEEEVVVKRIKDKKLHTIFDQHNNPIIRLSTLDLNFDVNECEKFIDNNGSMSKLLQIDESEKEFRKNIEDIKNSSQKEHLISELKSSEHTYVEKSLNRLVNDYMPQMEKIDLPPSLVGKTRNIFGNADILYEKHKYKFLPALYSCKTENDVAKCFLKYENIFKLYPLYTKNKPKSELIIRDFGTYFKQKQQDLDDRLDLSSYLLTPIQRLAKYCQLVKALLKECEKEGQPCEKLKAASNMLSKQMSMGNDLIALDSIINFDGCLRDQGDLLLRDTFQVLPPNRRIFDGMIFLFQESVLITSIIRESGTECFEYRDYFPLTDMGYTDNEEEPLSFKLWFRKRDQRQYTFRAKNKELRQKWVKELFNLLWKQLEASKRMKKKELETVGYKETKILVSRPQSMATGEVLSPQMRKHRYTSSIKIKKAKSETIWYSQNGKKIK